MNMCHAKWGRQRSYWRGMLEYPVLPVELQLVQIVAPPKSTGVAAISLYRR